MYEDADSCLCTVTLFMVYIFSVIYEDADSCLCTVTLFMVYIFSVLYMKMQIVVYVL